MKSKPKPKKPAPDARTIAKFNDAVKLLAGALDSIVHMSYPISDISKVELGEVTKLLNEASEEIRSVRALAIMAAHRGLAIAASK